MYICYAIVSNGHLSVKACVMLLCDVILVSSHRCAAGVSFPEAREYGWLGSSAGRHNTSPSH